ncbi:MAG TPA: hypothetical protein VII06_15660 [Chloroflexota bacterium]|jgi:hypothetical protein
MNGGLLARRDETRVWRDRRWALAACALLVVLALGRPAAATHAQTPAVVAEQVLAPGAGGLVSASLDPARRYSLLVLASPDAASFHGTYSQNWFARDGARRAGSNDGPLGGRTPWEQDLQPPAPSLTQWTFAAGVWNDGTGSLVVRIVDHGPR